MDRLRGAIQNASSRLGRNDPAPTATENASPHNTVHTVRQPPTEAPLPTHPPVLQSDPNTSYGQLPGASDSHIYLPSIRILRNKHDDSRPGANIGAVHDYATSPREADQTAASRQGNWWTRARQSLGFGHGEGQSPPSERDYDADTMVDALDALGSCLITMSPVTLLTSTTRPRSSNLGVFDQRSELAFSSQPWQIRESETNLLTHKLVARC